MVDDLATLRSLAAAGMFLFLAGLESIRPALALTGDLGVRWTSNIGLYAINTGLAIILGMLGLSGTGTIVLAHGIGLFPLLTHHLPIWAQCLGAIFVLDLHAYGVHRLLHHMVPLWALHGVHHADIDMDATTGLRHHPGEVVLTALLGVVLGVVLGIPLLLWAFYALLHHAATLVQHANLRLPEGVDRVLRMVLVTPAMHRHHHAALRAIHDTNYGALLSIWDRLFSTYRACDPALRDAQPIGLDGLRGKADQRLDGVLLMPPRLLSRNSP